MLEKRNICGAIGITTRNTSATGHVPARWLVPRTAQPIAVDQRAWGILSRYMYPRRLGPTPDGGPRIGAGS